MLQRTQLLLDDKTRLELLSLARESGRSMSDLAREFLAEKVATARRGKKISAWESLKQMVAAARRLKPTGGPKDLAESHDQYLY